MRFYLHDNGRHALGAGEPGIFQQSMQDLMAWAEKGIVPPPSTRYTIRNGQVIPALLAADRHGLQPVMDLKVNGGTRADLKDLPSWNDLPSTRAGAAAVLDYPTIAGLNVPTPLSIPAALDKVTPALRALR